MLSIDYPCRVWKVYLDGVGFINTINNNLPVKSCFMSIALVISEYLLLCHENSGNWFCGF